MVSENWKESDKEIVSGGSNTGYTVDVRWFALVFQDRVQSGTVLETFRKNNGEK